jgi:DNA-binding protein H-NS
MNQHDLEDMSLDELKELQKKVTKAINTFEDRQKQTALAALDEKARELGFSLAELTGGGRKGRKPSVPKYRNPDDPTMTWTGKGRQPAWFKKALEKGKSPEDMAI